MDRLTTFAAPVKPALRSTAAMASTPLTEAIKQKCLSELDAIHVECVDVTSAAGDCDGLAKLQLTVASPKFDALRLLQRHQLVNESVLSELMPQIHAISITTYTTEQHQRRENDAKEKMPEGSDA